MITHNKLIRDKIPEIMDYKGKEYAVRVLSNEEYEIELNEKLQEELKEYNACLTDDERVEELADVVEVIYALIESKGFTIEQFEQVRQDKKHKRGGLERKLLLEYVKEEKG